MIINNKQLLYSLLLTVCYLTFACTAISETPRHDVNSITARVTYYTTSSPYGDKVACQLAKRAKEGVTVAAHPDFEFGTRVYIPALKGKFDDGIFTVQDRGPAVTKKRASHGRAYVFDIYVRTHSKVRTSARNSTEYMQVYVIKA